MHLQICIIVHFFSEQVRARVQGPEVVLASSSRTSSALFGRVQGPEVVFASSSRGPARPTLVPPVSLVTPDQLQNTRARAQAARQPTRDVSRTLRWVVNAVSAFPLSEPPPRNRYVALHRPDAEEWRKARRAVLTALIELGVFREARRKRDGSQWTLECLECMGVRLTHGVPRLFCDASSAVWAAGAHRWMPTPTKANADIAAGRYRPPDV